MDARHGLHLCCMTSADRYNVRLLNMRIHAGIGSIEGCYAQACLMCVCVCVCGCVCVYRLTALPSDVHCKDCRLAAADITSSSLRSTQSLAGNAAAAAGAAAMACTRGAAERMQGQKQLVPVSARPALRQPTTVSARRFQLPRLRRRSRNHAMFASLAV